VPDLWLYVLGAVFIFVTLFLPKGLAGSSGAIFAKLRKTKVASGAAS
jgi:urea transport system permease protein